MKPPIMMGATAFALTMAGCASNDQALEPPLPVAAAPPEGWVTSPTIAEVDSAYPSGAKAAGIGGSATMSCSVFPSGQIGDCAVASESPAGLGFGQAALALAPHFRVGTAVSPEPSGRLVTEIHFMLHHDPASPPVTGAPAWAVKTFPEWFVHPSGGELHWAYPARAERMGVQGYARLECTVQIDGAASGCTVVSEAPAGQGFGDAALKLSPHFRMRPMTYDGKAAVATAIFPIRFALR